MQDAIIRSADDADRTAVVKTLARAFWSDPFITFFYPDEQTREKRIEPFFNLIWRANRRDGQIDVSKDCRAAALWRPPGRWRIARRTMFANLPFMISAYGLAVSRVLVSLAEMERNHLGEPHWYLMTLGTDPAAQGRGFGKALVRAGLARCDAAGVPAYLESGDSANIGFYEGLGFRLLGAVGVPQGPTFYPMIRPPVG